MPAETIETVELLSEDEFKEAHSVMQQLRTHLDEEAFLELVTEMIPAGYRLFALRADGSIRALAGIGIGTNLYYGKYLWVYDLITANDARSKGYGAALLAAMEKLAADERCETIALSSALHRKDAHRFYEDKMDFERAGYVFRKPLG
jgi:GNAT superfamily N-acetyltransferase